ncbi:eukaryotic translation initiation factor 3 subunit J [Mariannaea sp. PMI_226]|nr:eukaryotic translation initiation factor 3 subunit J [Mariannaea sp. PMI_226]
MLSLLDTPSSTSTLYRTRGFNEEDSDSDSSSSSPTTTAPVAGRRKFDDEEDDSDVLDSWDAAEDSEVEREKAKKAEEAKAKAAAEAAANKKSKSKRIEDHQATRAQEKAVAASKAEALDNETPAERRARLRRTEQNADLAHAEDLFGGDDFGDAGLSAGRAKTKTAAVSLDAKDPSQTIDIAKLPIFSPTTKAQFDLLRTTITPVITANSKKAHYSLFLEDFTKALARDLPSDQIKKIASGLTALGSEKMKEEKASQKGGKKTKAAKTKISLVTNRANTTDTHDYADDDGFGE